MFSKTPEERGRQERVDALSSILGGEVSIDLHLQFLIRSNHTDMLILKNTKDAIRVSICHTATVIANAFMHSGTTSDQFLRYAFSSFLYRVLRGQIDLNRSQKLKQSLTLQNLKQRQFGMVGSSDQLGEADRHRVPWSNPSRPRARSPRSDAILSAEGHRCRSRLFRGWWTLCSRSYSREPWGSHNRLSLGPAQRRQKRGLCLADLSDLKISFVPNFRTKKY